MVTKCCKNCGVEFDAIYPHSMYCSDACKREVVNVYARKYRAEHREQLRKYNREYYKQYEHKRTNRGNKKINV
jgi:hypothetical protein